ncbi:MAG TPA: DUF4238 domain-containing protein [Mesorhizobium sp.]|jgi:hypothetical protein|uniref:DUF4238 domain-containing protein n=1 Tax=Mesorhizobium sp. TaxID=1871066 RepID=UPI002DDDB410|nr:DUF4238 domain-containing protein [Mesorhizobium sp.]HEV2503712.1 DUF4238 domain-containing protein [Mesorhizobium sp.]
MAQDHYVPQVHLKNFYASELRGQMYAIRKADLKTYSCNSRSQCRIEDGSTNPYLLEPRIIEEFLKKVEPRYNTALEGLRTGNLDVDSIFAIAGFAAYVDGCSPAGMRIHSVPMRAALEIATGLLERNARLPVSPSEFGGQMLSELLSSGHVQFKVDPKYPQSMGIRSVLQRLSIWGNSRWEIIINEDKDSPFFTSDYPLGIEPDARPGIVNRIVPLAPNLAVRIRPDPGERRIVDLEFRNLRTRHVEATRQQIVAINTAIVQAAETTVYYSSARPWIRRFVEKYADFHVEPKMTKLPYEDSYMSVATMAVGRKSA